MTAPRSRAKDSVPASVSGHVRKSEIADRYQAEWVPVDSIYPSPENDEIYGRIDFESDTQLSSLVASIERMELEEPIICTADRFILSGHRRYAAVRHLGWKKVPVRFSKTSRTDSVDYHRLLAQYNPQRVKTVAATLSEQFLNATPSVTRRDFTRREYRKGNISAETIVVQGEKSVAPIGERQMEFLAAAVQVIEELENFWPLTVRQIHYRLLNNPPLTQTTRDRNEKWRYINDHASYKKLSNLLLGARYGGHVPIHALDDPTRISKAFEFKTWGSISSYTDDEIKGFLTGYQRRTRFCRVKIRH